MTNRLIKNKFSNYYLAIIRNIYFSLSKQIENQNNKL